jgi:hypothetical protein
MKKTLSLLLVACTLALTPGCGVLAPKSDVTYEASVYRSFRSVWDVTYRAYLGCQMRVAQGKVSAEDAADINAAWVIYCGAFRIALDRAAGNENAFTPDSVRDLADDVLTLIAATL